jgi:hypothetical protein
MLDAACPGEVFTSPTPDQEKRDEYYKYRKKAVTRTFDWFD